MKNLGTGLFAALAALAISSGAMAADASFETPTPTSNWHGVYAGIGAAYVSSTTIVETIGAVQGTIGANAILGSNFLLGAEAYVSGNWSSLGGPAYYAFGAEARAGVLVAAPVLLYGALGAEYVEGGNTYATLGGGVEFAVTRKISLDLEYKRYLGQNNPWQGNSFSLSANFHF